MTTPTRSRPRRRWLRRCLWIGGAVAAFLVAAWFWVAPSAVESLLLRTLARRGIADPRLSVASLSLGALEVQDIALGPESSMKVERLVATFSWRSLLAGRLETLSIEGVDWSLGTGDRQLRPFDTLETASDDAPILTALPDLPIGSFNLSRCRIQRPQGDSLEVSATAEASAERLHADLEVRVGDGQLLKFRTDLSGQAGAAAVRGVTTIAVGTIAEPLRLSGVTELQLDAGERHVSASLHSEYANDQAGGDDTTTFEFAVGSTKLTGQATVALHLRADLSDLQAGEATLRLDRATLSVGEQFRIEGLRGRTTLAALSQASSSFPPQPQTQPQAEPDPSAASIDELRWQRIQIGKAAAGPGSLRYRLSAAPPAIEVVEARCALLDQGRLHVDGFRFAAGDASIATRVRLEDLDLGESLKLMSQGRVSGDGLLTGSLEAKLQIEPSLGLELGRGKLGTAGQGRLRIADDPTTEQILRQQARRIARSLRTGRDRVVEDRIVDTLRNFAYTELVFEVLPNDGQETTLRVRAAGKGVEVPQELDMNLNFNGFDQLVELAFDLKFGLDQARARARNNTRSKQPK